MVDPVGRYSDPEFLGHFGAYKVWLRLEQMDPLLQIGSVLCCLCIQQVNNWTTTRFERKQHVYLWSLSIYTPFEIWPEVERKMHFLQYSYFQEKDGPKGLEWTRLWPEWLGLTDSYNGSAGDDHQNVFGKHWSPLTPQIPDSFTTGPTYQQLKVTNLIQKFMQAKDTPYHRKVN